MLCICFEGTVKGLSLFPPPVLCICVFEGTVKGMSLFPPHVLFPYLCCAFNWLAAEVHSWVLSSEALHAQMC